MPRRRAKLELTLFPFLSVLSGLIAVMVLFMIVTLTTRVISVEPGSLDEIRAAEAGDPAAEIIDDGIDPVIYAELERDIAKLEAILAKREKERDDLRLELRELRALLDAKEYELEKTAAARSRKSLTLGEPTPRRLIPGKDPLGLNRKPVFIEVNSSEYLVHPERRRFPIDPKTAAPGTLPLVPQGLKDVLEAIGKDSRKRYVILLIHPDGVDTFNAIDRYIARLQEGPYPELGSAWEPFSPDWLLVPETK